MKSDKLRGECENSQVTEELAVCTEEVEQLMEQLQSCDKEWQVRLRAETDRWQDRLEEQQQEVDRTSQNGRSSCWYIVLLLLGKRDQTVAVYRVMCCYSSVADCNMC